MARFGRGFPVPSYQVQLRTAAPPAGIQFVNSSTAWNDTGSASLVVNVPSGIADGQLLLLLVCQNNVTTTLDALSGWTDTPGVTWPLDSGTSRMYARYRFASSEPASYTLNWTGGTPKGIGTILAYSGVDGTTPFDANAVGAAESVSQATHTTGNLTTVTDQAWLVSFFADRAGTSGTWTEPAGDIERVDITVTGTSQDSCEIADTNAGVTIGTYNKVATSTVATGNATMLLIALRPTSTGGGSTNAPAENASGAGTAPDPLAAAGANAEAATGIGTAPDPTPAVAVNAEAAAGTGSAPDPTVSTANATNAAAEAATGTGSAPDPLAAVAPNAGAATGTGVAQDPLGSVGTQAEATAGTGAALTPLAAIAVNAEAATGTGAAFDATVSTAATTNAPAEAAIGTGAALDPSVAVTVNAGLATGTGAAPDATGITGREAPAGVASATGTALDASAALAAVAEIAAAVGVALDAVGFVPPPVPPPRWVEQSGATTGDTTGATTGSGQSDGTLVGAGIVEGSSGL